MKKKDTPPPSVAIAHYVPHAEQGQTEYYSPMLQGPATNAFAHISSRDEAYTIDQITGKATLENEDIKVFIGGIESRYEDLAGKARPSARKLLDAMAIKLTGQTDYQGRLVPQQRVVFPLEDYMRLCGMKITKTAKDEARKRIREDLTILYETSVEWEGKGQQKGEFLKSRICSSVGDIKGGNIYFTFALDVAEYLQKAYLMQYPNILFRLDTRNKNLWVIGRKLALHNSIDKNRTTGTANTLSVASLLKAAPDIPSHEEVNKTGRQYTQRIIKPLEACLDQLVEVGFLSEWTYWNARNAPLTDGQLNALDYETFIASYVHFTMATEPPDQTPRLEAKKARPVRKKPTKARA